MASVRLDRSKDIKRELYLREKWTIKPHINIIEYNLI